MTEYYSQKTEIIEPGKKIELKIPEIAKITKYGGIIFKENGIYQVFVSNEKIIVEKVR